MSISREVLAKYVTTGCLFIETGTRWGDTCIRAVELGASGVITVELDPEMAKSAKAHLQDAIGSNLPAVQVNEGSSYDYLSSRGTVFEIRPIVVFLDAHSETNCPILSELDAIRSWESKPGTIIIDDLRCMEGWGINSKDLLKAIRAIGNCNLSYEHGVERGDILIVRYI